MLSLEKFVARCAEHIEQREPFLAYWHEYGFGLLRTDKVEYQEYHVSIEYPTTSLHPSDVFEVTKSKHRVENLRAQARYNGGKCTVKACKKSKKAKVSVIKTMHKLICQMHNDTRIKGLHVVEYDGHGVVTEGGVALHALQAIQLSSDGDAARP